MVISLTTVATAVRELRHVVERLEELLEGGTRKLIAAEELAKLERLERGSLDALDLDEEAAARLRKALETLVVALASIDTWELLRATEAAGCLWYELSRCENELSASSDEEEEGGDGA